MKIWLFSQKGGDWQLYSKYAFKIDNTITVRIFEIFDSESSFRLTFK